MFNQSTQTSTEVPMPELLAQINSLRDELSRLGDTNSSLYRIASTLKNFPPQKGESGVEKDCSAPRTLTELMYELINGFRNANAYHESITLHLRDVVGADLNY